MGGTSGVTGNGETTKVTFSALSPGLTVTATYSGDVIVANIVVYDVELDFTPEDDFAGRSYEDFGVGEDIDVSPKIVTSSTSSAIPSVEQIGGLVVSKDNGDGLLTDVDPKDGTGLYTAGASNGTFTLCLQIKSGPSQGMKIPRQANQVTPYPDGVPTGANIARAPGTSIWHRANSGTAGFAGKWYIKPNNVSFRRVQVREGTCNATASGSLVGANNIQHPLGDWKNLSNKHDNPLGCGVFTIDAIGQHGPLPPFSTGNFYWPIPWYYRVFDQNSQVIKTDTYFATAKHYQKIALVKGTWQASVQKKNAGAFSVAAAGPSSNTGNSDVDAALNAL